MAALLSGVGFPLLCTNCVQGCKVDPKAGLASSWLEGVTELQPGQSGGEVAYPLRVLTLCSGSPQPLRPLG